MTAPVPHRSAAHVVDGSPDEIHDDVVRWGRVAGARVPGSPREPAAHGRVTGVGQRGRPDEVGFDAVVSAGDEPDLQVHDTALYRLDAA